MHCCVHKIIRFSHQQDPRGNPTNIEWHDNIRRMQREDILYQFVSFPLFFCHQEWYWYSVIRDIIIGNLSSIQICIHKWLCNEAATKRSGRKPFTGHEPGHILQFMKTFNYSHKTQRALYGISSVPTAHVIMWQTFLILLYRMLWLRILAEAGVQTVQMSL